MASSNYSGERQQEAQRKLDAIFAPRQDILQGIKRASGKWPTSPLLMNSANGLLRHPRQGRLVRRNRRFPHGRVWTGSRARYQKTKDRVRGFDRDSRTAIKRYSVVGASTIGDQRVVVLAPSAEEVRCLYHAELLLRTGAWDNRASIRRVSRLERYR